MNLIVISNNLDRASFRQRIKVHLDTLSESGICCNVARLPSSAMARVKLFRLASQQDAVFLHKKGLNFFDSIFLRHYSKKIIYDFDDAIMYNQKSPEKNSLSHFLPFRRTVRNADLVIAGNQYLAEHARKFNNNVKILPTGLDTNKYLVTEKSKNDEKIRLAWIGSKSTLRYLDEIKPALEKIGSLFSNVILKIICDDFFDLQNMAVEKCQWSETSEVGDLAASDIGLAPLSDDRFTRGKCGFKILQYAAAGLPIIASPVGINSEFVKEGANGFHAKDIEGWIDKIALLIENRELRKTMGGHGLELARKFDISQIERQLAEMILNLHAK